MEGRKIPSSVTTKIYEVVILAHCDAHSILYVALEDKNKGSIFV